MKKIVFILNSIQQQRCLKRIEEFLDNGFEVVVYGYNRLNVIPTRPTRFKITVLADIPYGMSVAARYRLMRKTLRPIIDKYKDEDVVYYYFLLDVALVGISLNHKPYIYENSDLMYGYFPRPLRWLFKEIDKKVATRSLVSIFTSEGFVEYLFRHKRPQYVFVIPNRLNKKVLQLPYPQKKLDVNHLTFTFVGALRQPATQLFIETLLKYFPQHEFHFYGVIHESLRYIYDNLAAQYSQCHIYGAFSNPDDLPSIYEHCDILLSAMGLESTPNVEYAEPNKFYEAIYFRKPIIVSEDSYVGRKVKSLGIGFCLSDFTENGIKSFLESISEERLKHIYENLNKIPKEEAVDGNPQLFSLLDNLLSSK